MHYLLTYRREDGDHDVLAAFNEDTLGASTALNLAHATGHRLLRAPKCPYERDDLCVAGWEGDVTDVIDGDDIDAAAEPLKRRPMRAYVMVDAEGYRWYFDKKSQADKCRKDNRPGLFPGKTLELSA